MIGGGGGVVVVDVGCGYFGLYKLIYKIFTINFILYISFNY
jgi:hypothetical protein